ncbi:hypothetical protein R3W88_024419 [Solanum pinnatisectum]|uniref:Uncharacterized protein n=1 Tax=Solanum pinnatisectum TaxID=50273 RepID=A0AAV9M0L9_9SOLN|nr:hypothetical protein R3W88_024419 [Solanum pinnatisectum]
MILCLSPVLHCELRLIIQIDGGKVMSSYIDELYTSLSYLSQQYPYRSVNNK